MLEGKLLPDGVSVYPFDIVSMITLDGPGVDTARRQHALETICLWPFEGGINARRDLPACSPGGWHGNCILSRRRVGGETRVLIFPIVPFDPPILLILLYSSPCYGQDVGQPPTISGGCNGKDYWDSGTVKC